MITLRGVLLNWNDHAEAERCIDALQASGGIRLDLLVVDNGSSGPDVARFRARLGPDRVLALDDNLGYAGGMNAGIRFWQARPGREPILLITPDARVGTETLAVLAAELEREAEAGVVGPLVVHSREGSGWVTAGGMVRPARVQSAPLQRPRSTDPHDVEWIDGCCMLVRPDVLRDVAGFDERYFIYFEETDFCARVRRKGWRVRLLPGVEIDHPKAPGTLPPYYFYYMVRNRYLFWAENHGIGFWKVAATVAWATLRAWGSVAKAVVVPGRRREVRARLRDARLQLRAAWVGSVDHLRRRYGRMPESRMPRRAR